MNQKDDHQVTIRVINNSESFVGERCYLAGSFNNWSVDRHYLGDLPAKGNELVSVLHDVHPGSLELKVTRGSWATLQSTVDGKLPPPFTFNVNHDVEFVITIDAWRDEFPASTASPQVKLMDGHFYLPNLNRYRKVWIYLPKDYVTSDRSYPVLYMHDGQHLFDEATSVGRAGPVEWMVDETIDEHDGQVIVIGIDHASTYAEREEEFLIHPHAEGARAKGEAYLEDIVAVVKPYVDQHYRTIPGVAATAMLGSSLGGLITLYAAFYYPKVFGTLGVFSPSIWMDREELYMLTKQCFKQKQDILRDVNFYFYVGGREKRMDDRGKHENMARDLQDYATYLEEQAAIDITVDFDPHGKHGAQYWQQAFKRFYSYWQEKLID